jgi:FixJ family two-component response regulator
MTPLKMRWALKAIKSRRPTKFHRARVMKKMQAGSLAELVRFAERLGL